MSPRPQIGIMHGRLSSPLGNKIQSFPQNSWQDEFKDAAACGFECIEWIFDQYEKNPIVDESRLGEIKSLSAKHDVRIGSVLADYFMEKRFFDETKDQVEKNLDVLRKLIKNCRKIDVHILEIPFVDTASISTQKNESEVVENLGKVSSLAKENGISVLLETDMEPHRFRRFMENFDHSVFFANYDTGNSTALGYDMEEELNVLSDRIKNIHIKDRILHGKTVPLGTGDTNFDLFFSNLKKINYNGDLIIQGAREDNIAPKQTCEKYHKFVKQYVDKYFK